MVEINNLTFTKISEEFLKKVAVGILKEEGKKDYYLSVALVGLSRIKKLNKKYLNRDYGTDILAFPETDKFPKINNLGEIIICLQVVKKNAKRINTSFKGELARVLIHGILHLLGYDHEKSDKGAKIMEKKENYYLKKTF